MDAAFDVLVAGEINADLILTGDVEPVFGQVEKLVDGATLAIGSSSCIFACGAARLGLKVAFVGVAGDDRFGHFVLDAMQARGVDISAVIRDPDCQTGLSVILSRVSDRAILTHLGAIASLEARMISNRILACARHLHVGSYFLQAKLQPDLPGVFERAHHHGLTTSLDTNWDPLGHWEGVRRVLKQTDVFLPNENEALAITEETSVEDAARKLGEGDRTVAVKLGARGAVAYRHGELVTAPSGKVDVMDTVGAGDSFDAGFIFGFLHDWDIGRSLRLACACGALSTRAHGGTEGQPELGLALTYAEQLS